MDNLREACLRFQETKDNYNKVLRDHQELRKKCDAKLKEEMQSLLVQLDEIASCAHILLDVFHHYGDVIRFPIDIYENKDDCLIFSFTKEGYGVSLNSDENILYKSSLNIDEIPTSCYEILVLNKDLILNRVSGQIKMFFDNETKKLNDNIESENAYYDMLTGSLFPEEIKSE